MTELRKAYEKGNHELVIDVWLDTSMAIWLATCVFWNTETGEILLSTRATYGYQSDGDGAEIIEKIGSKADAIIDFALNVFGEAGK